MTNKYTYTQELLDSICMRDDCILIKVENKSSNLTCNSIIHFQCKCGKIHNKSFHAISEYGAYCKQCTFEKQEFNANRVIYNRSLLDTVCERDKCKILNLDKILDKLNCKTSIEFVCACGKENSKQFIYFNTVGGFCKECGNLKMANNPNKTYTKELLQQFAERDKFIIDDYDAIVFRNETIRIKFTCYCGNKYEKRFITIKKSGGFCQQCTKAKGDKKREITNLERHGVKHTLQSQEVRAKGVETCIEKYGETHHLKSKEVQEKKKQTCLDKYDVEHQFLLPEVQEKCKNTIIDKYHVESPMQSEQIREKHKQTCLQTLGCENPMQSEKVKEKYRETCLDRYDGKYPTALEEVQAKRRETCMQKYNVEHPSQDPVVSQKQLENAYKKKQYIFPCGTVKFIQGYENFLLDILLNEGYTIDDIKLDRTDTPIIEYYNPTIKNIHKISKYYCDIYVPKTNTIYEVKSTFTYFNDLEINLRKRQACLDAGYNFEFFIFRNDHGSLYLVY